ncbi:hypothetical protein [Maricaulis parjimensis]|uniref:hypothetical protein n=1 Tax=Maricaulis parjimensis TaxID=144023 RepID=UPI001939CD47|nr:hypothetical protein [Maricaulis parjimensis]
MIRLIGFLALTGLLITTGAEAQPARCDGYDLEVSQQTGFSYDASRVTDTILTLQMRVREAGLDPRCDRVDFSLAIENGTAANPELLFTGETLEADWERSSELRRTGSTWQVQSSARRQIVGGDTLTFAFYRLAAGQFVVPGSYSHTLRITVGDRETSLPILVQVEPALRFEGESAGGNQAIDLGDVGNGARGESDFFYRTNSGVAVTLVSDNRGHLVHERGEAFGRIPYRARLSGTPVDLTGATGTTVDLPYQSSAIQAGRLEVEVDPVPASYAGRYSDVVTLSFIPF